MTLARVTGSTIAAGAGPVPPLAECESLLAGRHSQPHRWLGVHACEFAGRAGVVVRAFHPEAVEIACVLADGRFIPLEPIDDRGLFSLFLPGLEAPLRYRLRRTFRDGGCDEAADPYSFLPTVGELDLHLIAEGTHRRLWQVLGAHPRSIDGVEGVAFAVWAPNAVAVHVVGDFCCWDGRALPMRSLGGSGVFELFVPGVREGALYKYEILTTSGTRLLKADPLAQSAEKPPATASRVFLSRYRWRDSAWVEARRCRDPLREPMSIYEVHLPSWRRTGVEVGYRELAAPLIEHCRRFGFTHLELLPLAEHPFYGSWGYQTTSYYAPTARLGGPDDLRFFVDECHRAGIGVIFDWVPAHFPRDDFALARFDGTPLYEYEDPRLGEHPDWGTLIFNTGRNEVRNFLIANALYWFEEFHADGLRVDAVASMLYRDYSRKEGEWIPNEHGGRENLEAIAFLRELNAIVASDEPGCFTVAEESTAWPGVTRPVSEGGLGFTLKWNLGWMHDTLGFFSQDPLYRNYHLDRLTFAMLYEYSERFVMPLSHDEIVHGKRSLLEKMPGDLWQKFANLRVLLAYQFTRPGKQLLFMGTELAPDREWDADGELDWRLSDDLWRSGLARLLEDLGRLYLERRCLWRRDHEPDGFAWIDCNDRDNCVVSYQRLDGDEHLVVVLNLLPVPREDYRIGAPAAGRYRRVLSTDAERYAGSGWQPHETVETEPVACHGRSQSMRLRLPPLSALILEPVG